MTGEMEEVCLCVDPFRFIFRIGGYGERVVKEIFVAWQLPLLEIDDTQAGGLGFCRGEGGCGSRWRVRHVVCGKEESDIV